jgi:hypothetical protein
LGDTLQHFLDADEPPDLVIYESFRLYAHKAQALVTSDMIAAQAIGIIRYFCWRYHASVRVQSASQGKGVTREMVEERLDYDIAPYNGHQWDACRHALAYILGEYNRRQQ